MVPLSENEFERFIYFFGFCQTFPEKDLAGCKRPLFSPRIEFYDINCFVAGDTAAALDAAASPVLPIL